MAPTRFSSGLSLWSFSFRPPMGYSACLYRRVSYPTGMPACQPSLPNAERNLRNRPEVRVTRSTAKSADRYSDFSQNTNATDVALKMMSVSDFAHCDDCALAALRRLDFSHLSTSTLTKGAIDVETGRRIPNIGRELRKMHPIGVELSGRRRSSAKRRSPPVVNRR